MPNLIVSAVSTFDNKGLKKGTKEISAFDKNVKNLGKTFGKVFAATALLTFAKKAVNAFAADEAAAKALEVQLKNTGFAFASPYVENYIANLQKLTGVLDDNLRPAFQALLTATRSITLSQNALNVALDTSAATGKSLQEVTDAIVKGYNGQTKGLKTLGVALSKTALKTGNMEVALKELQKAYAGQAAARLETFAGKVDLLKVAAADATEIIGKGLVDALIALGKDKSIENAADSMNKFALAIADTIRGLGILTGEVKKFLDTDIGKFLAGLIFLLFGSKKLILGATLGLIGLDLGKSNPITQPNIGGYSGIPSVMDRIKIKELDLLKKSNAARAAELAALNKKSAVDKLKEMFDVDRVGLYAALASATDDETKLRLKALIAIQENDEAAAKLILAQLNAAEAVKKLSTEFDGAGIAVKYFKDYLNYRAGERGDPSTMTNVPSGGGVGGSVPSPSMTQSADYQSYRAGERANITVQVGDKVIDEIVLTSMLNNQKNGRLFDVAGGL
jgi:hypothetical protein